MAMQQLHGTERDSVSQLATIVDIERHATNPWEQRDSQRQLATIADNERHAATPWDHRDCY